MFIHLWEDGIPKLKMKQMKGLPWCKVIDDDFVATVKRCIRLGFSFWNARWKGINFMTIWETEFPFLIIKWCPIIIFSEVPWWLKLSYLTQGHKEIPEGPKAKLEASDLHSRMYHTMKIQAPFTTGTHSRLPPSLPVLLRMDFCETAVCLEFEGECRDPKI